MAKASFENYGKKADFLEHKVEKLPTFNDVSGGGASVDPYGNSEKKEADAIDMNAGEAFNKKDYTKVEAMGTDYPKKGNSGQRCDNNGDHLKAETDIAPGGSDAGKTQSFQSRR